MEQAESQPFAGLCYIPYLKPNPQFLLPGQQLLALFLSRIFSNCGCLSILLSPLHLEQFELYHFDQIRLILYELPFVRFLLRLFDMAASHYLLMDSPQRTLFHYLTHQLNLHDGLCLLVRMPMNCRLCLLNVGSAVRNHQAHHICRRDDWMKPCPWNPPCKVARLNSWMILECNLEQQ